MAHSLLIPETEAVLRGISTGRVMRRYRARQSPLVANRSLIDLTSNEFNIMESTEREHSWSTLPSSSSSVPSITPPSSVFSSPQEPTSYSSMAPLLGEASAQFIDLTADSSDEDLIYLTTNQLTERIASIQSFDSGNEQQRSSSNLVSRVSRWQQERNSHLADSNDLALSPKQAVELNNGCFFYIEKTSYQFNVQILHGRHLTPAPMICDHSGIPKVRGELIWMSKDENWIPASQVKKVCFIRFTNERVSRWHDHSELVCRLKLTLSIRPVIERPFDRESRQAVPEWQKEYAIEYLTFEEAGGRSGGARTAKELRDDWRGHGETIPFGAKELPLFPRPLSHEIFDLDNIGPHFLDLDEVQARRYTFGDAYCGAGGMSCGARKAGLELTWAVDKDGSAIETYRANYPNSLCEHSEFNQFITTRSEDLRVDVCHTSPPCQPFSPAHTIANQERDEMNSSCIFSSRDLIVKARPRILTMEETFGLLNQHREILDRVIMDFVEVGPGETLPNMPPPTHGPEVLGMKPYETIYSAIRDIPDDASDHDVEGLLRANQLAHREAYDGNCQANTLTCSGGQGNYHPSGKRKFTLRESACLQTFPINFKLCGRSKLKQIGNAVPPRFAAAIFKEVCKSLRATDEKEMAESS